MDPRFKKITVAGEAGISYLDRSTNFQYNGRADYIIGPTSVTRQQVEYSFAVCEAKIDGAISEAKAQLITYISCVRATRKDLDRTDVRVYGIASDGHIYQFIEIQESGRVRLSRTLHVVWDLETIVNTITFILEQAMNDAFAANENEGVDYTGATEDDDDLVAMAAAWTRH